MKLSNAKAQELILEAVKASPNGAQWEEIVALIKSRGYVVKNWLTEVRGSLQALKNDGQVKRTDNIFEERFIFIGR